MSLTNDPTIAAVDQSATVAQPAPILDTNQQEAEPVDGRRVLILEAFALSPEFAAKYGYGGTAPVDFDAVDLADIPTDVLTELLCTFTSDHPEARAAAAAESDRRSALQVPDPSNTESGDVGPRSGVPDDTRAADAAAAAASMTPEERAAVTAAVATSSATIAVASNTGASATDPMPTDAKPLPDANIAADERPMPTKEEVLAACEKIMSQGSGQAVTEPVTEAVTGSVTAQSQPAPAVIPSNDVLLTFSNMGLADLLRGNVSEGIQVKNRNHAIELLIEARDKALALGAAVVAEVEHLAAEVVAEVEVVVRTVDHNGKDIA